MLSDHFTELLIYYMENQRMTKLVIRNILK